jgi:hypothetical protein
MQNPSYITFLILKCCKCGNKIGVPSMTTGHIQSCSVCYGIDWELINEKEFLEIKDIGMLKFP